MAMISEAKHKHINEFTAIAMERYQTWLNEAEEKNTEELADVLASVLTALDAVANYDREEDRVTA
jgi:hypothetical protein